MTDYDRTVHARNDDGTVIVRYDRAGKWYIENLPEGKKRRRVTVKAAAMLCRDWRRTGTGNIIHGLPGGKLFERRVYNG